MATPVERYIALRNDLRKLDASGNQEFSVSHGYDLIGGMANDVDGDVYVFGDGAFGKFDSTGVEQWQNTSLFDSGNEVFGAISQNGTLYVAENAGMNAHQIDSADGSVNWSADASSSAVVEDLCVDSDDNVYIGGEFGILYSYDSTGTERWAADVLDTDDDLEYLKFDEQAGKLLCYSSSSDTIYILNPSDGSTLRTDSTPTFTISHIERDYAGNSYYIGSDIVESYDDSGNLRWDANFPNREPGSASIDKYGTLHVETLSDDLSTADYVALDSSDGTIQTDVTVETDVGSGTTQYPDGISAFPDVGGNERAWWTESLVIPTGGTGSVRTTSQTASTTSTVTASSGSGSTLVSPGTASASVSVPQTLSDGLVTDTVGRIRTVAATPTGAGRVTTVGTDATGNPVFGPTMGAVQPTTPSVLAERYGASTRTLSFGTTALSNGTSVAEPTASAARGHAVVPQTAITLAGMAESLVPKASGIATDTAGDTTAYEHRPIVQGDGTVQPTSVQIDVNTESFPARSTADTNVALITSTARPIATTASRVASTQTASQAVQTVPDVTQDAAGTTTVVPGTKQTRANSSLLASGTVSTAIISDVDRIYPVTATVSSTLVDASVEAERGRRTSRFTTSEYGVRFIVIKSNLYL